MNQTGPTIIFVLTVLIVVVLFAALIRRASRPSDVRDKPVDAPDRDETAPQAPADGERADG
jgi:hypothetical protein